MFKRFIISMHYIIALSNESSKRNIPSKWFIVAV